MTKSTIQDVTRFINKIQKKPTVNVTVVIKPNRGKRDGDGSGTQSRITVHEGDSFSGRKLEPSTYIAPGQEGAHLEKLKTKYGTMRVAVEVRKDDKRTYEGFVI